jgi:hypothetical protein
MVLMSALIMIVTLGVDSFLASLFLGALGLSRRELLIRAFAFGACDGAATWVAQWHVYLSQTVMLCLYLVCALAVLRALRAPRLLLWAVAISLSLDNLIGNTPDDLVPYLGASSAAMSLLGSGAAALIRNRWLASRLAL